MAYNSYNAIVARVQEAFEDTSTEFVAYIPNAINLGEKVLQKSLDLHGISSNLEETLSVGDREVSKPSGYRLTHNIFLVKQDGSEKLLKHGAADYLRDYAPNPATQGEPVYFSTDYSADKYYVVPTPSEALTLRIDAEVDVTPITSSNQTNFFTKYTPEALFYATMVEQCRFAKAWDELQVWQTALVDAITAFNNQGRRDRRVDGSSSGNASITGPNKLLETE